MSAREVMGGALMTKMRQIQALAPLAMAEEEQGDP